MEKREKNYFLSSCIFVFVFPRLLTTPWIVMWVFCKQFQLLWNFKQAMILKLGYLTITNFRTNQDALSFHHRFLLLSLFHAYLYIHSSLILTHSLLIYEDLKKKNVLLRILFVIKKKKLLVIDYLTKCYCLENLFNIILKFILIFVPDYCCLSLF